MTHPVSPDANYPMYDPASDSGKYILGLLEAGTKANGTRVQAVGSWLKPTQLVEILSKAAGEKINFVQIPADVFKSFLPPFMATEMTENMQLIGEFDYFGKGANEKQGDSDKWLLDGTKPVTFEEFVGKNGPWKW